MEVHLQSTIFGQLVRMLSRNGKFKYPDEMQPSLWKVAIQRDPSQEPDQSQQCRGHESPKHYEEEPDTTVKDSEAQSNSTIRNRQSHSPTVNSPDVVVVGWYGSDDPEVCCDEDYHESEAITNSWESCAESPKLAR